MDGMFRTPANTKTDLYRLKILYEARKTPVDNHGGGNLREAFAHCDRASTAMFLWDGDKAATAQSRAKIIR
jgi:hypothetical protein